MNKHRHCSQVRRSAGQVCWSSCPCTHGRRAGGLGTGQQVGLSHFRGMPGYQLGDRQEGLRSLIFAWGSLGLSTWHLGSFRRKNSCGPLGGQPHLFYHILLNKTSHEARLKGEMSFISSWRSKKTTLPGAWTWGAEEWGYSGNMTYPWLLSLAPRCPLAEGGQSSHHICPSPPPTAIPTFDRSCFILEAKWSYWMFSWAEGPGEHELGKWFS